MITEGSCINQTALYIATAALGAATDLIILIMPIPMVFGLRMARSQKIGLIFMFALGSAYVLLCVTLPQALMIYAGHLSHPSFD